jgi:hypothetical protein
MERGAGASMFPSKYKKPVKAVQDAQAVKENQAKMKEGLSFSEKKGRQQLRGNLPSTRHHEGIHRTLTGVENKYDRTHRENIVSHMLESFFDSKDIEAIRGRTKELYGDKVSDEEILAHIPNLLQQKKYREESHYKKNPIDLKRIGSGWKKAIDFTSNLKEEELRNVVEKRIQQKKAEAKNGQKKK